MARPASDTLSLTSTQRKTAWNDLNRQALERNSSARVQRDGRRNRPERVQARAGPRQDGERHSVPQVLRLRDDAG